MTDGFGAITWWGFSPALDLQEEGQELLKSLENLKLEAQDEEHDVNILMIGAGDSRHMLKTLSNSYKWKQRKITFYILENNLELYARHMLFLIMTLEPQHRMGLQEKTELYLELFGNSLVRQQSMDYVERMATQCIKMVTDFDYLEKKLPLLDLSLLKFKERDFLEGIFKFWRNKTDATAFNVEKCWELRLRQYLAVRYDSRKGVFDWDFHMKLCDRDAEIIHKRMYADWRETGVAFQIREGTYNIPNKTLASGLLLNHSGEKVARRGYWGDIIVSPYISFGIECEEKMFFKKSNNMMTKCSVDVSQYNVTAMLHEVVHKTKYIPEEPKQDDNKQGATLTEITEEDEDAEKDTPPSVSENNTEDMPLNPLDLEYEAISLENVRIRFLPLNCAGELHKKSKYSNLFNVIYFSNSMVHNLTPDINATFADSAAIVLETTKFMLEVKPEQRTEFVKKITEMANAAGCKEVEPCDPVKQAFAKFSFQRKS